MAEDKNATQVVGLLVEVANSDTVYQDLYLRRARQLLTPGVHLFTIYWPLCKPFLTHPCQ
jgi:hypothetical protein